MTASGLIILAVVTIVVGVFIWCRASQEHADARAEALLQQHLSPSELAQLTQTGALQVTSRIFDGRIYAIPTHGFVTVREQGKLTMRLCIRPSSLLPGREAVLAHKMYIEAAEDEYVRKATVVWRAPSLESVS
jgi:hypothetical protein